MTEMPRSLESFIAQSSLRTRVFVAIELARMILRESQDEIETLRASKAQFEASIDRARAEIRIRSGVSLDELESDLKALNMKIAPGLMNAAYRAVFSALRALIALERGDQDTLDTAVSDSLRNVAIFFEHVNRPASVDEFLQTSLNELRRFEQAGAPSSEASGDLESIELWIDVGHARAEDVRRVLAALNDLHIAAGGDGFEFVFDGDHILVVDAVPA